MDTNRIYNEDCLTTMGMMPDNFLDLVVTSPPYDDLRSYKGYSFDFDNIARELFRTVKGGGVLVWVVGDAVVNGGETGSSFRQALHFIECGFKLHDTMIYEKNGTSFPARRDGNRYSQIFEYMFVFSKGKPAKASLICDKENRWVGFTGFGKVKTRTKEGELIDRKIKPVPEFSPRNNIWRYNTGKGYSTKDGIAHDHPAIFPEALAEDHILSWSGPGDLIYDPFMGSGTVAKMALLNGRNFIGSEISEEYTNLALNRIMEY